MGRVSRRGRKGVSAKVAKKCVAAGMGEKRVRAEMASWVQLLLLLLGGHKPY